MSLLNQLFNRGLLGAKCKTCLNLSIARIKLLQNKRDMQLKHMRREIAQFLQAGQEAIARIRVEHVIREENIWAAYEILELFCEFILSRVPILESQRECPSELREAVASIIFAAPRCSDVPDLLEVRNLFASKYGKEFIAAASELRPDTSVNRTIVEKLSVNAPSAELRLKLLKDIAQEHNVEWDYSKTEAELRKNPEDLLNGPKQVQSVAELPKAPPSRKKPLEQFSTSVEAQRSNQGLLQHSNPGNIKHSYGEDALKSKTDNGIRVRESAESRPQSSSDVLERAKAAIAAADRATAAARAAALLANITLSSTHKLEDQKT